ETPQRFGIVDKRVEIDFAQVMTRIFLVVDGAQVGPDAEALFDAADGPRKTAAAVSEAEAQVRQPFQNAAENQRANGQARFRRLAHQPGEPVVLHAVLAEHIPGVDENGRPELFRSLKNRKKTGMVQVPIIDVRADLHAGEAELLDTTIELRHG